LQHFQIQELTNLFFLLAAGMSAVLQIRFSYKKPVIGNHSQHGQPKNWSLLKTEGASMMRPLKELALASF
jgi:hypothetical protein